MYLYTVIFLTFLPIIRNWLIIVLYLLLKNNYNIFLNNLIYTYYLLIIKKNCRITAFSKFINYRDTTC